MTICKKIYKKKCSGKSSIFIYEKKKVRATDITIRVLSGISIQGTLLNSYLHPNMFVVQQHPH
jgi:hypothetical protein